MAIPKRFKRKVKIYKNKIKNYNYSSYTVYKDFFDDMRKSESDFEILRRTRIN